VALAVRRADKCQRRPPRGRSDPRFRRCSLLDACRAALPRLYGSKAMTSWRGSCDLSARMRSITGCVRSTPVPVRLLPQPSRGRSNEAWTTLDPQMRRCASRSGRERPYEGLVHRTASRLATLVSWLSMPRLAARVHSASGCGSTVLSIRAPPPFSGKNSVRIRCS
jgi:hypothetical protein